MVKKIIAFLLAGALVLSMFVAYTHGAESAGSMDKPVTMKADHTNPADYVWDDSEVTPIVLQETSITVEGDGATVNGNQVTITAAGTYNISGALADGQIIVNTEDEGLVRLILNGININSSTSAPIYVAKAAETLIVLEDNTENYVSDGTTYLFDNVEEDEPNAAIFSKSNLTIYGNGTLTVSAHYRDGIISKDGLVLTGGTLIVNAVDDGIRGKDYLVVKGGQITVNAQGDGLKADNAEDSTLGYISIESGVLNVTAGGDALQAETYVAITDGNFTLISGGGSTSFVDESLSAKGIKAALDVRIDGGIFTIDAADDALHSNNNLVINGGTFLISTGDDALHADTTLDINGGTLNITASYEGLESAAITINAGEIHIISSDDGLNVVGGNDGSGMMRGPGGGGRPGGQGGQPGQDAFAMSGNYYLHINGGYIVLDADGDGIDINGSVAITDGVLIVNGPTQNMNGALDYDGGFAMTGGLLVAAGSSGIAQAPDQSSTQPSLLLNFTSPLQAGTLVHIQSSDGSDILTFSPTKSYQSITFSSPKLVAGAAYTVYYGGSSNGTVSDSLYQDGVYTPGTEYTRFTVSGSVTMIGQTFRR